MNVSLSVGETSYAPRKKGRKYCAAFDCNNSAYDVNGTRTSYITTSRRFKCVPTFRGSLSIHIFMLLFRFIAESSLFSSDFTRECKTAIEIGAPFEEMCETFLLFSAEKRTAALIPIIVL